MFKLLGWAGLVAIPLWISRNPQTGLLLPGIGLAAALACIVAPSTVARLFPALRPNWHSSLHGKLLILSAMAFACSAPVVFHKGVDAHLGVLAVSLVSTLSTLISWVLLMFPEPSAPVEPAPASAGTKLFALVIFAPLMCFSGCFAYMRLKPAGPPPKPVEWYVTKDTIAPVNEAAATELRSRINQGDKLGVQKMVTQGRAAFLTPETKFAVIKSGLASFEIVVLSGNFSGTKCIVPVEHIGSR